MYPSAVITVLKPDPEVPLSRFEGWLTEKNITWELIDVWKGEVPDIEDIKDGLIMLGGSTNAESEAQNPWMADIKSLLRAAIAADMPVLGICLGHQTLASALGGQVSVADSRGGEHGAASLSWLPVAEGDPVVGALAKDGPCIVPESHNDAVTVLPPGALELARTELYPNQAFRYGSALGVQFHPEATPDEMGFTAARAGLDREEARRGLLEADEQVKKVGQAIAHAFATQVLEYKARRADVFA
ncbi:MAG: type 1 glutamine amidotransferase [Actinomycetaceae bacterium]|nr:type 1 glutamine amidotransferase [Actinomycetaceae bacterium]